MARQNDHKRAEELISAYLDQRVSFEEKTFFEGHLASCAACRAQLDTTRSMIAALKALPAVKAPRSFVLPREMGRQSAAQPKRSFLSLYPALRLATVIAAMAFVVLFAGDLLINQMGGASAPQSIPAAAPAPVAMQAPEMARQAVAPTQEPAAGTAANDATLPPAEAPAPAGASAKASATAALTETTMAMAASTATPEATTVAADTSAASTMMLEATPELAEPMVDQQTEAAEQPAMAYAAEAAPAPTIDPLRVIEIALLILAVVLGIATIMVRRRNA